MLGCGPPLTRQSASEFGNQTKIIIDTEDVEVRIRISPAACYLACQTVSGNDREMCPLIGIDGPVTVEDYLAHLLEEKLK